eukprot:CAMPEP_0206588860 /NCGR_PEP_ID=MMETSP0325_2-20121206/38554_1 /ASSEMBLY_ACC=CAM_ASM_000347 /TAXON_ID=2866 /ORGANISM="Crypthecodinium cohnii, Strain Seligo" /LENGTH=230 /DNA_ID=CAMNT_0054097259 /DNA_START=348 /DNA_END=1040 /DNA_ORIENTATION=+
MEAVAMPEMSGVFSCTPRCCEGHSFFTSIPMGVVRISSAEVLTLIEEMEQQWTIEVYDLLRRNCCHFCQALCARLGVGPVPDWVTSLAGFGESLFSVSDSFSEMFCCRTARERCRDQVGARDEYLEQEAFAVLGKGHWMFQEPSSELLVPRNAVAAAAAETEAAFHTTAASALSARRAEAHTERSRSRGDYSRRIAGTVLSPLPESSSSDTSRWAPGHADALPPDVLASI